MKQHPDVSKLRVVERTNKEIKLQLDCYKKEVEQLRNEDVGVLLDQYQKLVSEYNCLYDHYSSAKVKVTKYKQKVKQSTIRERKFLSLLK